MRLLDAQNGKFIMAKTLILIPSRMSANRLPGKPLLKINNLSIISHVFKKAKEAKIGEVVVATEDKEILDDVEKNGGRAILTGSTHKTGTDRIFEAYEKLNIKDIDFIINLQGDEPAINKDDIINFARRVYSNNYVSIEKIQSDEYIKSNFSKPIISPITINRDSSNYLLSSLQNYMKKFLGFFSPASTKIGIVL